MNFSLRVQFSEDRAFSARFKFLEAFQRVKGEKLLAEVGKKCTLDATKSLSLYKSWQAGIEALETTARSAESFSQTLL